MSKFLESLRDDLNKELRGKSIKLATEELYTDVYYFISTGNTVLDAYLGGGIASGRVTEIYSKWGMGKSTLETQIFVNAQKRSGIVELIDTEGCFEKYYAQTLGLDLDEMLFCELPTVEGGFKAIKATVNKIATKREPYKDPDNKKAMKIDLPREIPVVVSWDTLSNAPNEAELAADRKKGDDDDDRGRGKKVSLQMTPRIMRSELRKLTVPLGTSGVCLLVLCQSSSDMGQTYWGESSGSGWGVKFVATHRIHFVKETPIMVNKTIVGHNVKVLIEKNKFGKSMVLFDMPFMDGIGFDDLTHVMNHLLENGIVKQNKAWCYYRLFGEKEEKAYYMKDLVKVVGEDIVQYNYARFLVWATIHKELMPINILLEKGVCTLENINRLPAIKFNFKKKEYTIFLNEVWMNYKNNEEFRTLLLKEVETK